VINQISHIDEPVFKSAISTLVAKIHPVKIICFGFHSSSSKAWSCFHSDNSGEKFHYDILIVRKEKDNRKESTIFQEIEKICSDTLSISAITHSEYAVQKAIALNNPFFIKLFTEGAAVYSGEETPSPEFKAASPTDIIIDESKREKEWNRWFELSERFLSAGSDALGNKWHDLGVFLFHQAVEHCCIALLRAHTGYRLSTHSITKLLALVRTIEPRIIEVFPCNTTDEEELFTYLRKSYSDVRYKERYYIPPHIAFTLLERVSEICNLIKEFYNNEYDTSEDEEQSSELEVHEEN